MSAQCARQVSTQVSDPKAAALAFEDDPYALHYRRPHHWARLRRSRRRHTAVDRAGYAAGLFPIGDGPSPADLKPIRLGLTPACLAFG